MTIIDGSLLPTCPKCGQRLFRLSQLPGDDTRVHEHTHLVDCSADIEIVEPPPLSP